MRRTKLVRISLPVTKSTGWHELRGEMNLRFVIGDDDVSPDKAGQPERNRPSAIVTHQYLRGYIRLLWELDEVIARATRAVVESDPATLRSQTLRQHEIVRTLLQFSSIYENAGNGEAPHDLHDDLRRATLAVTMRNRVHGALLRRSWRTLNIFRRLLVNTGRWDGTYTV